MIPLSSLLGSGVKDEADRTVIAQPCGGRVQLETIVQHDRTSSRCRRRFFLLACSPLAVSSRRRIRGQQRARAHEIVQAEPLVEGSLTNLDRVHQEGGMQTGGR